MIEFDKYKERGAYHWRQYERNPVYRGHVKRVLGWVRKGLTLDVGAGDGLITFWLKATGVEIDKLAVSLAKARGADVRLGSTYDLSKYREYDNVLLLDVLEHLEDPIKALNEIRKVLKPDGLLYITTPPPLEKGGVRKYHHQEWTPRELMDLMIINGFKYVDIENCTKYTRIYAIFKP